MFMYILETIYEIGDFFRSIRIFALARLPYALSYDHMVYIKSFILQHLFLIDLTTGREFIASLIVGDDPEASVLLEN